MDFLANWEVWRYLFIKMENINFIKDDKVCVYSHNSRGFSDIKKDFCRLLLSNIITGDKLPILCNQENFILRENSYKVIQALPNFQVIINPAIKNNLDHGRPCNSMFIAFPDTIKNQVTDVSPSFWRLQAIKIKFVSSTLLLRPGNSGGS